jgi:hypothetical protein
MLAIIFWILWVLCFIGVFIPPAPERPWLPQLNTAITLILFGILGFKVLAVRL